MPISWFCRPTRPRRHFLMADLERDVGPVIEALRRENVEVGRRFPALPTHLRVTIGTRSQMERFLATMTEVMQA